MGNDLLDNAAGIPADAHGVEGNAAVEAFGSGSDLGNWPSLGDVWHGRQRRLGSCCRPYTTLWSHCTLLSFELLARCLGLDWESC